jgi:competence ComEA-like helix-hairpin-helix protein
MWKAWFVEQFDWFRGWPFRGRERKAAGLMMLVAVGAFLLFAVQVGHTKVRWIDIRDAEWSDLEPVIVNINKAPWTEMTLLPGIGKTIAQRIVQHREEEGRFEAIDELIMIRGIGSERLRKLRPNLVVE